MTDNDDLHDVRTAALYAASRTGLFPQPKTSIYRYVGMRGTDSWMRLEQTLLQNVLPLTPATMLNDPFESSPVIVDDVSQADIAQFCSHFLRSNGLGGMPSVAKEMIRGRQPDDPHFKTKQFAKEFVVILKGFIQTRSLQCHIGSFSRRIASELQWSHYGDGHKGLAYHFVTLPRKDSGFRFLHAVEYSKQRPILLVSEMMDQLRLDTNHDAFTRAWLAHERRVFLTKSYEWAYEEEERVVKQNQDCISFLKEELISLIIGPRFPPKDLKRLRIINSKREHPLKVFAARPSQTSYAVEVDWTADLS